MKFEEAYVENMNEKKTIEEITFVRQMEPQTYKDISEQCFLCPQCLKARLIYVNGKIPYFRAKSKEVHEDNCLLRQDLMTVKQSEKFSLDINNDLKAERQLESILFRLTESKQSMKKRIQKRDIESLENKNRLLSSTQKVKTVSKRIGQKRLDYAFSDDDYDCYKYFYGSFIMSWEKATGTDKHKLLLWHIDNKCLVCKLFISGSVYKYIDVKYKQINQKKVYIAFLGIFKKPEVEKTYKFTYLQRSSLLKIALKNESE